MNYNQYCNVLYKTAKTGHATQACKGSQCVLSSVLVKVIYAVLHLLVIALTLLFLTSVVVTFIPSSNGNDGRSGSVCICRTYSNGSSSNSSSDGGGGESGVSLCHSPSHSLQSTVLQKQKITGYDCEQGRVAGDHQSSSSSSSSIISTLYYV